jgi:hypothetical protein
MPIPEHGETVTSVPIIAEDKVIAGFGGDEFAARGRLVAYDLKDRQAGVEVPQHRHR